MKLYKNGHLILNEKNIEKLDNYMSSERIVDLMKIMVTDR